MVSSSILLSALVANIAFVSALPKPQVSDSNATPTMLVQSEMLIPHFDATTSYTYAIDGDFNNDNLRQIADRYAEQINSTVAFAAPTAYYTQTTNLGGFALATQYACPPGMLGVGGYCCPGVWISGDCYRTATDPLEPYTSISFKQNYTKPTNQIKNPFDPNAKLDSSSADLTFPFIGALAASLIGALFVL